MNNRGTSSKTIVGIIALIAALGVFAGVYVFDKIKTTNETIELRQKLADQRIAKKEQEEKIADVMTALKEKINSDIPGIVCWGDEFTYGSGKNSIPNYLENKINDELFFEINEDMNTTAYLSPYTVELSVKNNGMSGEDLYTMAARSGAYPLCIGQEVELPRGTGNTEISFITKGNRPVRFADLPNLPFGNCTLDGVEGTIETEKVSEGVYNYYFSKNAVSDPQTVAASTRIYTSLAQSYPNDYVIMFFGRGYNEIADLVNIQRRIANNRETNNDKFIAVAMTESGSKLDAAMLQEFGENYLRIDVPGDGSVDNLNVADAVFQKLDSIGYLDTVKNDVADAQNEIKKIREG